MCQQNINRHQQQHHQHLHHHYYIITIIINIIIIIIIIDLLGLNRKKNWPVLSMPYSASFKKGTLNCLSLVEILKVDSCPMPAFSGCLPNHRWTTLCKQLSKFDPQGMKRVPKEYVTSGAQPKYIINYFVCQDHLIRITHYTSHYMLPVTQLSALYKFDKIVLSLLQRGWNY